MTSGNGVLCLHRKWCATCAALFVPPCGQVTEIPVFAHIDLTPEHAAFLPAEGLDTYVSVCDISVDDT
jgi:hypothetical protein